MSNRDQRTGFALPAVLAVTGVVTIVFLVAITALASLTSEAASSRSRVRFLERAMTAEASLQYLATTQPMSRTGFAVGSPRSGGDLGETSASSNPDPSMGVSQIYLDGRPYLDTSDNVFLRLQDQAGMINLSGLSDQQWQQLGERLGISPVLARQIGPRFRDYTDTDDLALPGGAERSAYGVEKIANRPMRRSSEWLSLLGVRQAVDSARWRALRHVVAADQTATFVNANTAPASALEILFGFSPSQAQAAIRARANAPFNSMVDLAAATGAPAFGDAEVIYTFPTGRVVYEVSDTRSPWTYRARLTLTPSGLEQPVWIDQTELTEAPRRAVADISDATRFPYAPR